MELVIVLDEMLGSWTLCDDESLIKPSSPSAIYASIRVLFQEYFSYYCRLLQK